MRTSLLACAVGAALIAGCGSMTELEGIYTIDSWTENTADCAAEGPSVLASRGDTGFYIREESFFGKDFVNAVRCTDMAECEMKASDSTINFDGWAFDSGSDGGGWKGATTFAGTGGANGQCTGTVDSYVMTSPASHAIRIESQRRNAREFPPDSDGFCDTDAAVRAADGEPCIGLEVVTGTFVKGL